MYEKHILINGLSWRHWKRIQILTAEDTLTGWLLLISVRTELRQCSFIAAFIGNIRIGSFILSIPAGQSRILLSAKAREFGGAMRLFLKDDLPFIPLLETFWFIRQQGGQSADQAVIKYLVALCPPYKIGIN
jgi:hypothetical protein